MRTLTNDKYHMYPETDEQQHAEQRYNPASIIKYKNVEHTISAGTSDHVYCFREDEYLIVLAVNYRYGYVGLEVFALDKEECLVNIFYSSEEELEEYVGKHWDNLSEITIAKRLYATACELDWENWYARVKRKYRKGS